MQVSKAKMTIRDCDIHGDDGIHASSGAAVTLTDTTLRSTAMRGVHADSGATLDITRCTISANGVSGTAIALQRSVANVWDSRLEAATGINAERGSCVELCRSRVRAWDNAVRAHNSNLHIFDRCNLSAANGAAVAAVHYSRLLLKDCTLLAALRAVVAIVASTAVIARNYMHAPAGLRNAAMVFNHLWLRSAIYGNVVHGGPHHIAKFVFCTWEDEAAVGGGAGILQHRALRHCDLLTASCAAYTFDYFRQDVPAIQDEALWLRQLGAKELALVRNLHDAALRCGEDAARESERLLRALCELLQDLWRACANGATGAARDMQTLLAGLARAVNTEVVRAETVLAACM